MSISNVVVKGIGVILAIAGLFVVLSTVGLSPVRVPFEWYWSLVVGGLFIGAGVVIIKGGTITA